MTMTNRTFSRAVGGTFKWESSKICSHLQCALVQQPDLFHSSMKVGQTNTALSTFKKRKVDSENRQFNDEWTEKYAFIAVDANPVRLICHECLAMLNEYNLRRHFTHNAC